MLLTKTIENNLRKFVVFSRRELFGEQYQTDFKSDIEDVFLQQEIDGQIISKFFKVIWFALLNINSEENNDVHFKNEISITLNEDEVGILLKFPIMEDMKNDICKVLEIFNKSIQKETFINYNDFWKEVHDSSIDSILLIFHNYYSRVYFHLDSFNDKRISILVYLAIDKSLIRRRLKFYSSKQYEKKYTK